MQTCLVTGAAGYIGSHTLVALLEAGYQPIAVDNYCNSKPGALRRVIEITGKEFPTYEADVRDERELTKIFAAHAIDAVIHFAGLKAVGESVGKPLAYYDNNIGSTLSLLRAMTKHDCFRLVFSSSATVYGEPKELPIKESAPLSATSPYGRTKLFIEEILRDLAQSDPRWKIALLRYFNPVGAHPSGLMGEDPQGIPNNLLPYIAQVAVGRLPKVRIFGRDYPTQDGTGVRDYIHVCDVAEGHVSALNHSEALVGAEAFNLGTGKGYSVLEVLRAFESASGVRIPYEFSARRAGDVASCCADPSQAKAKLSWQASRGLAEMSADLWRWQTNNPQG